MITPFGLCTRSLPLRTLARRLAPRPNLQLSRLLSAAHASTQHAAPSKHAKREKIQHKTFPIASRLRDGRALTLDVCQWSVFKTVRYCMSSSSSPEAAAIVAAYEYTRTLGNVEIAVVVLLVYDAAICMGKEVQYVWRAPKTSGRNSRILYLYIRYLSIIFNVYDIALPSNFSTMSCTVLGWIGNILPILTLLGPAGKCIGRRNFLSTDEMCIPVFATLRVYALSARNKVVTGIALLLSFAPFIFIINVATLYLDTPTVMPPPVNCANVIPISQKMYTGVRWAGQTRQYESGSYVTSERDHEGEAE